jgi:hypothetical protein
VRHHCEGLTGWWTGPCPSPFLVLPSGEPFTPEQEQALHAAGTLIVLLSLAILVVAFAAWISSMAD